MGRIEFGCFAGGGAHHLGYVGLWYDETVLGKWREAWQTLEFSG